jgi:hypothetical protein
VFIEVQARFFVLMAVGNEPSKQMHYKIGRATMTRMLDLRNILELVDNRFDNRPFAQQELVRQVHEPVFHVFAQSGDELEALFKEQLREGSGNVAAISEQLAAQSFDHVRNRSPIIDVLGSQATSQQIASIIDHQVQFKAEKPPHARLATPGINRKDVVSTDPFRITD